MNETTFHLDDINPMEFWGIQNENFETIKKRFPKLRLISRGSDLKVLGDDSEIANFTDKFNSIIRHFEKFNKINTNEIEHMLEAKIELNVQEDVPLLNNDVIVYGANGVVVRARTINQRRMVDSSITSDILFAIGPAGTGKTYTAVAMAVRALKNKEVKRIILTRPAVEAGESLGFLPGDLKEKVDPYLRPLYDALDDMIPADKLKTFLENRTIEIAPLAFMRGRTLDNCFVILDEAQNTTDLQMKMFLTRMGPSAKLILTGDITQIDLPRKQQSGLFNALKILENIEGIEIIYLSGADVVRHRLVKKILEAYGDIQ